MNLKRKTVVRVVKDNDDNIALAIARSADNVIFNYYKTHRKKSPKLEENQKQFSSKSTEKLKLTKYPTASKRDLKKMSVDSRINVAAKANAIAKDNKNKIVKHTTKNGGNVGDNIGSAVGGFIGKTIGKGVGFIAGNVRGSINSRRGSRVAKKVEKINKKEFKKLIDDRRKSFE